MSWRDNLQEASWRGIRFEVKVSTSSHGRRGAEKEFPNIDGGIKEDQGRKQRHFTIEAFLIGDDFMERRDALQAASEDLSNSGFLILPWQGKQKVSLNNVEVVHAADEGRMCRLSLEFCEHNQRVNIGFKDLLSSITDSLSRFAAPILKRFIAVVSALNNIPETNILQGLKPFQTLLENNFISEKVSSIDMAQALTAPQNFTSQMANLFVDEYKDQTVTYITKQSLKVNNKLLEIIKSNPLPNIYDDKNIQSLETSAIYHTAWTVLSINLHATVDTAIYYDFSTHDEAKDMMEHITKLMEAYMQITPSEYYQELIYVKTSLIEYFLENYANLAKENLLSFNSSQTSLTLAYDLYDDIERRQEIANRNNINHPLFIPAGVKIKVLNK